MNFRNFEIIFVIADELNLLKAFKFSPADFLSKPFIPELVVKAIFKASNKCVEHSILSDTRSSQIMEHQNYNTKKSFLSIASIDKVDIIQTSDIMFCKAEGRYTNFFLSDGNHLLACKNIGDFERNLDLSHFHRIHRSFIINLNYVTKVTKKDGSYCELQNGISIPISKRRQEGFKKFIQN